MNCGCYQCQYGNFSHQLQLNNLGQQMTNMGLGSQFNQTAIMNAMANANGLRSVQPTTYPVVYQVRADAAPKQVKVGYEEGDMRIYDFAVGKVPAGVEYDNIDVFLDLEDLPDKFQRPAMMLHAAYNGEAMSLEGVGSIRPLSGGVLYYRVALT